MQKEEAEGIEFKRGNKNTILSKITALSAMALPKLQPMKLPSQFQQNIGSISKMRWACTCDDNLMTRKSLELILHGRRNAMEDMMSIFVCKQLQARSLGGQGSLQIQ
jgi:hypothetical protein